MTTKDQEKIKQEFVHLYIALRRKKENPDLPALCIRKIIFDDKQDLEILKLKLSKYPGIWRIHKTVNKRDCKKAMRILIHKLIDCPEKSSQITSLWKTCLLKPESRGERNFLLDFDGRNPMPMQDHLKKNGVNTTDFGKAVFTPNGVHFITKSFDIRILEDFKEVTVHRDGYLFISLYEVTV